MKRGFSMFLLFGFWVNILNLTFDKTIPNAILKKGLYKKYHIEFEKIYL
jgi:hypothetical protein